MQELRGTNWQVQHRQEGVKNGMGNGEAEELICTTHGHELRGNGGTGRRRAKGENWENRIFPPVLLTFANF